MHSIYSVHTDILYLLYASYNVYLPLAYSKLDIKAFCFLDLYNGSKVYVLRVILEKIKIINY